MGALVNLRTQVQKVLRMRWGGLGNRLGYARATIKACTNRTGGDLPLWTLVRLTHDYNDARIEPTDTDAEPDVLGVVVGYFDPDDPEALIQEDAPDTTTVAVLTHGTVRVLIGTGGATRGEYAYASADDGTAYSDATAAVGAFGVFQSSGTDTALVVIGGSPSLSAGSSTAFGTPAFSYGTSNTAGSIDEAVRRDAGLAIFDTADPVTLAFGDVADPGNDAFASRLDHVHGMPAGPPAGTVALGLYGDGHDGDFVLDGSNTFDNSAITKSGSVYTLARNILADDFSIDSGVDLVTAGWMLFVRGTLTVDGTIRSNGNNGGSGGTNNPGGAVAGQTLGSSRAGGAGATTDANGTNGTATDTNGSSGGPGGNGGNSGTGRTGGTGGSARSSTNGVVNAPSQGGIWSGTTRGRPFHATGYMYGLAMMGTAGITLWAAGASGGGGAKGTVAGAGGGGGGGGGIIVINASQVVISATGVIRCNGGNGAAGSGSTSGGGGGGGGGVIGIMTDSYSNSGTVECLGGSGGAAGVGGSATAGGDGGPGNVHVMTNV